MTPSDGRLEAVLRRLEREGSDEATLRQRAGILVWMFGVGFCLSLLLAVAYALLGGWAELWPPLAGALLCVVVLAVWWATRSLLVVSHLLGASLVLLFTVGAMAQQEPFFLSWNVLVPMTVLFLGGLRVGALWLAVATVATVGGVVGFATGLLPMRLAQGDSRLLLAHALMFLPVTGLIAFLFEYGRVVAVRSARKAQLSAELASADKDRFLANVSHEIRTPLSGVLGMTEVLLATEAQLSDTARGGLRTIQESGKMLRVLIDDLLDVSRAREGKLKLTLSPFRPSAAVGEVAALYAPSAASKGLDLAVHSSIPEDVWLQGDGVRVAQILANLVSNAVKYTSRGQVTLTGRLEGNRGQRTLTVDVADTGVGIAAEDLGKLFKPFSQVNPSLGGTGLGLAVSRQLATLMGGSLGVESQPGRGSTFTFAVALPVVHLENTPAPVPTPERRYAGCVLVVDDNAINARVASALLARTGVKVLTAVDGAQALEVVARGGVDLVLMDCQMPVMDGYEATRELRAREKVLGGHLPVVALTAAVHEEELAECLTAGMDATMTKPVTLAALHGLLGRYLSASASASK